MFTIAQYGKLSDLKARLHYDGNTERNSRFTPTRAPEENRSENQSTVYTVTHYFERVR